MPWFSFILIFDSEMSSLELVLFLVELLLRELHTTGKEYCELEKDMCRVVKPFTVV